MKKLLALFLVLALVFCSACGAQNGPGSTVDNGGVTSTPTDSSSPDTPSDTPSDTSSSKPSGNKDDNPINYNQYTQDPSTCDHVYKKADCSVPKTCVKCGTTEGGTLGHDYSEGSCTEAQVCKKCGDTKAAKGHDYKAATCLEAKTCKVCGVTEGSALGHDMSGGLCTRCDVFNGEFVPKLYFTGNMSGMSQKSDVRQITYSYKTTTQVINGAAKIKVQGSSSLSYEKKNYTINFYKDNTYSKKATVDVGWGAQNEYCLKANWIDKTHCRNVVTAKLVGQMQKEYKLFMDCPNNGAVDGFPIEVYINGEFHGVYTMNIPKDAWMFNMDEDNPNHIVICGENWTDVTYFKALPTDFSGWSVEIGEENDQTLAKIQRLARFIKDSSDAEFKKNFSQYLNLDATLNYYILMRFAYMRDNSAKNMLLATYDGNIWYPSLYDLDTTWGTYWTGKKLDSYKSYLLPAGESLLWKKLENSFAKEIAERYFELRKTVLSKKNILDEFNSFYDSIPDAALAMEKAKWDKPDAPIPGYDISQIEDYLDTVIPKFDELFSGWR
ncbi:MAG: CotH kinase family protein [Clostridia bacterium]|nr:CotH kinase family protein [Clostridia bacterium]